MEAEPHILESKTESKAQKKAMKRRLYWALNLGGWLGWAIAIWQIKDFERDVTSTELWHIAIYTVLGIMLTHIFRQIIHAWNLRHYDWKQVMTLAAASAVFLSMVRTLMVFAAHLLKPWNGVNLVDLLLYDNAVGAITFLVWLLIYFSYQMWENYQETEANLWKAESLLKETELKAFKAQVNPHFLFNSLNSLRALVGEEPEKARDAIDAMAHILRYALSASKEELVPLMQEVETVKQYLYVEKIRFEEKINVKWMIADNVGGSRIPPLSMQTILENAVKYGYQTEEGIIVEVDARKEYWLGKEFLVVCIRNKGKLKDVSGSTGVGVMVTRERLAAVGGSFEITEELLKQEAWVQVIMKVPV